MTYYYLQLAKGDSLSVQLTHEKFGEFSQASGLQANLTKISVVLFGGVQSGDRTKILQVLDYSQGDLPFKYLGVPLSSKKLTLIQWQPLMDPGLPRNYHMQEGFSLSRQRYLGCKRTGHCYSNFQLK